MLILRQVGIILTFTYIKYGLLVLISIVIWLMVFFLSNFLIGLDPNNREMYIIRIISILIIIIILYYNSIQFTISSAFIVPLSVTKITYLNDLLNDEQNNHLDIIYISKPDFIWFDFADFKDVMNLLSNLGENKAYVVTFELILDQVTYEAGDPTIILGSPILISKRSNPWIILDYFSPRVLSACNSYNLDENLDFGILVKYKEIKISFRSSRLLYFSIF